MTKVTADSLPLLRTRTSAKWTTYPPDVLPLWVAEMDYPLAPVVAEAIINRVRASDTGYVSSPIELGTAFAGFARRSWGWRLDPSGVLMTTDVSVAIVETLRVAISPGDGVVITPPVYPPFFDLIPEAGGVAVEVPLVDSRLDLEGLERAFAAGAKGFLLCNPHNPLGVVHSALELEAVAALADRYGVIVVSDEIHGPLVHSGVTFTPYLSVSAESRDHGVAVSSASKAWNLAGVKCALMVTASDRMGGLLATLPYEVGFRTSLLGFHASVAAFEHGSDWLAGATSSIEESSRLLTDLLAQRLPDVGFVPPRASYLAWLNFRDAPGWGDDPSVRALAAGVALNPGPTFGSQGAGFARLNLACGPEVLTEAIERLKNSAPSN
ncbi:MAG: aminotransferase class I/II-fold pyridoxal phosphate-dependent enzyme [Salinibacterium sp.]|nr:aminotransferase class I/II-fold pyridoxal phosphate-dependent enzyme [Salinibacterium sp.]